MNSEHTITAVDSLALANQRPSLFISMNSISERLDAGRNRKRGISLPDMAPFGAVFFFLVLFHLMASRPKLPNYGIVPLEHLAAHTPITCWKGLTLDGTDGVIISLNAKNQLSFASPVFDKKVQAEIFRRVASLHRVSFTKSQIDSLETLPFLAMDVNKLPSFLNLLPAERQQILQSGKYNSLDSLQLSECIKTSQDMARENHEYGPWIYLKIDSAVKMPQVERLIAMVNAQGRNRFNLLTQSNHIDYPLNLPITRTQ